MRPYRGKQPTKAELTRRQQAIEDLKSSGDLKKINDELSVAYLTITITKMHIDNATDILDRRGMLIPDFRHDLKIMDDYFQHFHMGMKKMMPDKESQRAFNHDGMELYDIIEDWYRELDNNLTTRK